MKKKPISAMLTVGLIFAVIGTVFLISGTACLTSFADAEAQTVGLVHTVLGTVFCAVGVVLLLLEANRRRRHRRLLETGRSVWCRVVCLEPNTLISVNGRHPYYAVVRQVETDSRSETYRSDSVMALRDREDLIGRNVKVYLGENPGKDYYVDITSLLDQ